MREPLEKYKLPAPLESLPTEDIPKMPCVSKKRVKRTLLKVNPTKAATPDMIPNWLIKEYANILAFQITEILNASYSQRRLPSVWKMPMSLTRAEKEIISGSEDPDKCKELRISFARNPVELDAVVIDRKEVKEVSTAKLLGLTISANLTLKKQ